GKKQIEIPAGVKVQLLDQEINVTGPKEELKTHIHPERKVEIKDNIIFVSTKKEIPLKKERSMWGLYRALISNMVEGVSKGYEKKLEIEGVGFKAAVEADCISLSVGFIHPVKIKKPEGVTFLVEKNVITVSGISKEKVGQVSAEIRQAKKAEPYKGKGIKYQGEKIRRKEGKKVVASK
ncbi:MAG: 50S ribosomal protein L6, partial [Candidatus Staskawiczbacteria bacterium]